MRRQMLSALAIAVAVIAAVALCAALLVDQRRAAAERDAFAKADLQVGVAAQQIRRYLASIDGLIEQALLCRKLRQEGQADAAETVEATLTDTIDRTDFGVLQVGLGGDDGWMRWSSKPGIAPRFVGDGEPLQAIRAGARGMLVSDVLVSRTAGRGTVRFFRGIWERQPSETPTSAGSATAAGTELLAGFAVVSVSPLALSARLRRLWMGENVTARLARQEDGVIIADSLAGADFLSEGAVLSAQRLAEIHAANAGHARRHSVITGRDSFMAFRVLDPVALVAMVNIDAASELAPAERDVAMIQMVAAFLMLGCAAFLAMRLVFIARQAGELELTVARQQLAAVEGGRAELEQLLSGLPVAAFQGQVSASGAYTRRYMSANIGAITGWTLADVPDPADWARFIETPGANGMAAFMRNVLQDGSGIVEYRVRRPQGGMTWVRVGARLAVRNPDGSGEVIGTIADVTNERELALQAAMTSKLSVLGEMASGLAHELNQPITVIMLAAERALGLLAGGRRDGAAASDDGLRHALDLVAAQTRRAADIIDQLGLFGRGDTGPPGPVRLEHALRGAMTLVAGPLRNAEVQVHTELPANLPAVLGRLVPIEQVLINLCMNARDALLHQPAERRHLSITAEWSAGSPSGWVRVMVRDTGGGLPEPVLARLFEPFVTTKAPGAGTGLGLSICQRLMRDCGGDITVRNLGGGAAFTLTFQAVAMAEVPLRA